MSFKFNKPSKELIKALDSIKKVELKDKKFLPDIVNKKKEISLIKVTLDKRTRTNRKTQKINGHWKFDKVLNTQKYVGFIYLIHDVIENKRYIGKKQYKGTGKVNKGQETNWKWYISSCLALQASIKANGIENFEYYVLDEYIYKGSLGYAETWSLMYVESPANRDLWYNSLVQKISWNVKEYITEKHKYRLQMLIEDRAHELEFIDE
jgi:hypothetical protein